jgi:hypothetical protein
MPTLVIDNFGNIDTTNPYGTGSGGLNGTGADCTANTQALVATVAALGKNVPPVGLKLPRGLVNWATAGIVLPPGNWTLKGAAGRTTIMYNGPGPVLTMNPTGSTSSSSGAVNLRDVSLVNGHAQGQGGVFNGVNDSQFVNLRVKANLGGLVFGTLAPGVGNCLNVSLEDCRADGDPSFTTGLGFSFNRGVFHTRNLGAYGCGFGVRCAGQVGIDGCHGEQNRVFVETGLDYLGNSAQANLKMSGACSGEANLVHLHLAKATYYARVAMDILGDQYGPTRLWPNYGILIDDGASYVSMEGFLVQGSFAYSAIKVGAVSGPVRAKCVSAQNKGMAPGGSTTRWDVAAAGTWFAADGCDN